MMCIYVCSCYVQRCSLGGNVWRHEMPIMRSSACAQSTSTTEAGTDTHIIADYAHFTVAAEAAAWEEPLAESLAGLAPHVRHIHARVGYENGPQVPRVIQRL